METASCPPPPLNPMAILDVSGVLIELMSTVVKEWREPTPVAAFLGTISELLLFLSSRFRQMMGSNANMGPIQKVHHDKWRALPDQTIKWHHRGGINSARTADRSGVTLSKGRNTQACLERGGSCGSHCGMHKRNAVRNELQGWKWGSEKIPKAQKVQAETSVRFCFSLVSKCKQK